MGVMKSLAYNGKGGRKPGAGNPDGDFVELQKYEREWTANMVTYWRERLDKLRVIDTGRLFSSIVGMLHPGPVTTIEHSFLLYGKYVSNGVGRNFLKSKEADGTIPFLLPGGGGYRRAHGLDKPKPIGPAWHRSKNSPGDPSKREAGGRPMKYNPQTGRYEERDWFFAKYYGSRMNLNEAEQRYYGGAYRGLLTTALDELFREERIIM